MILDELLPIAPHARVVTIDTGVLFDETLATWRAFEERFGVRDRGRGGARHAAVDRARALLRRRQKVAALDRALAGADAWITGLRREQGPTRAATELVEVDAKRGGIAKYNPLAHWTERDLWNRIHERGLPYHPLHDAGLRVDRLRAVHAARQRPRGPLGGHRQDRVRAARAPDGPAGHRLRPRRRHPRSA